jgi:deoxyribonuclease-1-like protein
MKQNELKILLIIFIILLVLILCTGVLFYLVMTSLFAPPIRNDVDTVSIASWNLQNFGSTKAANMSLLQYYAQKLDDYDVFILQEINDPTGLAIQSFAAELPNYHYLLSSPAGQGTSKEQYAIFYNMKVTLLNVIDWTVQEQSTFERPPLEATFSVKNWTFTICTIHVKVDNVPQELTNLEHLLGTPTNDTILLGDLNADGENYYDGVLYHFLNWHWLITSEWDTTVAKSSNAYDRIIINEAAENNFISVGIMDDVTSSQSDHYLIFAHFNPDAK